MKRIILIFLSLIFSLCGISSLKANNIHITKDLKLDMVNMTTSFVKVNFAIQWENSWRDDFNWDAAYIFMKYKTKGSKEWKQVFLRGGYHEVSAGYNWWLANTGGEGAENAQGIFVYRDKNGSGTADVDITLHWNYAANSLSKSQFAEGDVEYTAMCIEMVYVPNGAFYLGDNTSARTFLSSYQPIPERFDLIKQNGDMEFDGDALINTDTYINYPPSNAANRVNVFSSYNNNVENAWVSSQNRNGYWEVRFKEPKTVKHFGVSGVYGRAAPTRWILKATNAADPSVPGVTWETLFTGEQKDWPADAYNSYPVSLCHKIEYPKPYRTYRISILEAGTPPALNNVSMTEVDLSKVTDYAFVVDNFSGALKLSNVSSDRGLYSKDDDNWSTTTLSTNYPTGCYGFYAMKYEVSQEQYVKFLNKLTLSQQKSRTIGDGLTFLKVGDFVFGATRNKPNNRNSIVIAGESLEDSPVVFANNLNYQDEAMSQDDDGKTLACNYLTPADMLAYADWAGLRPMSEMEYEKACRAPFPDLPELGEFAWNSGDPTTFNALSSAVQDEGTESERPSDANVNALGTFTGPVRCGSFAHGADKRVNSGASFWGLMEMSGNLAEIYYNTSISYGRAFAGQYAVGHGDGAIHATTGNSDNNKYWPIDPRAFGLRGGSFKSQMEETSVSNRKYARFYSEYGHDINKRDSTVTFRLAHSYASIKNEPCTTYLELANKRRSTANGVAIDTVCAELEYTIYGSDILNKTTLQLKDYKGRVEYMWYISENNGSTWNVVAGARDKNLTHIYTNNGTSLRDIWVKRVTVTPELVSVSSYAILRVVNTAYKVHSDKDTINNNNHALGILIVNKTPSSYIWRWKGQGQAPGEFRKVVTNSLSSFYDARRDDFRNQSGTNFTIECEIHTLKCINKVDVEIHVMNRKKVGVLSSDILLEGSADKRCGVEMMDARDGTVYGTVKIGNQCWMAENLRYSVAQHTFQQKDTDPSGKYIGSLYKFSAIVRDEACPPGWQLPTDQDFVDLKNYLNRDGFTNAGIKMKAGNFWNVTNGNYRMMGTNSSGFGAAGAGHYSETYVGRYTFFLTYSGSYFRLGTEETNLEGPWGAGNTQMSIRCIKK